MTSGHVASLICFIMYFVYSISTLNSDSISKIWDEMRIKSGYNRNWVLDRVRIKLGWNENES
jgi:hypothetical protein